jgi:hypothetical protein
VGDSFSTQTLHQPTCCSSGEWRWAAGNLDDAMSSKILKQPTTCCILVSFRDFRRTDSCCSFQKVFFRTVKALSVSYSRVLAESQKACSEIAWKLQITSVMLAKRWFLFITVVCHNTDRQASLPPLLWLPEWGPGQKLGPTHMLQNLCGKSEKLFESQKAINAFCPTHGVKRADGR